MKALISNKFKKNILVAVAGIMMLLLLDSCNRKISFQNSSVVPAARGNVKVKKDNNHNYVIQIELVNLAEVKRLTPPKDAYVVWMVTDGEVTKNIGQIKSSTNFLSNTLKASFQTVSSTRPNKIFITAEDDAATTYPGTQILWTDGF